MHSAKWSEYRGLHASAKIKNFEIGGSYVSQETIHAFAGPCAPHLLVLINKGIVDIIIDDMKFYAEKMHDISRACLLLSFAPTLDLSEKAADAGGIG